MCCISFPVVWLFSPFRSSFNYQPPKTLKTKTMKANLHLHFGAAILLFTILGLPPSSAFAQGTAFSYQGQLYSGTNPARGTYNFEFSLFNVPSGGSQLGALVITNNVSVTNGMFMVLIDFGAGIF